MSLVVEQPSSFQQQSDAAYMLAIEAQRLRGKGRVFVFHSRAAVWHGLERALREMLSPERVNADGKQRQRNRIAAYMDSDVLKEALIGSPDRWDPMPEGDVETDTLFRLVYDTSAAFSSGIVDHVVDDVLSGIGGSDGAPSIETRSLRVRHVLEGYKLDESLWRYDFGILDGEYGCPDDEQRAIHDVRIRSGWFDFKGVCRPCDLLSSCRYQRETLPAPGIIVGHQSDDNFNRVVSVLLGPVPFPPHRVDRSRLAAIRKIAKERMGEDAEQTLTTLLGGGMVPSETAIALSKSASKLHIEASKQEALLRARYNTLKARRWRGRPPPADYYEVGEALKHAVGLRQALCGLKMLFELGRWPELLRQRGRYIRRPVIMPPLHGLFIVFPDNVEEWREHLAPFGASFLGWPDVTGLLRDAPPIQRDLIWELVDGTAQLMREGAATPRQRDVAERLGIALATVKDRLRSDGTSRWSWEEILEAARRVAGMEIDGEVGF